MRLTISALGLELDVTFGLATDEPAAFEPYQDAGTTGSTPVGFAPSPSPEWEMAPSPHQFDPEPDGEE